MDEIQHMAMQERQAEDAFIARVVEFAREYSPDTPVIIFDGDHWLAIRVPEEGEEPAIGLGFDNPDELPVLAGAYIEHAIAHVVRVPDGGKVGFLRQDLPVGTALFAGGRGGALHVFQARVKKWLVACFGKVIANDRRERSHRFLEEALELYQACGCPKAEALQMVDYVYSRPVGEIKQEIGGVLLTVAGLADAHSIDQEVAGEAELSRVWLHIEQIREKQARKPSNGPLPE